MDYIKLESIVLRFRDLSTKDTIGLHNEKIEKKGQTWWGWWAKPQEKVPTKVFDVLKEKISANNSVQIFLFDSGKEKIYSAKCSDIIYDENNEIKSPKTAETPMYYNKNKYYAWFCLSSISEVSPESDFLLKYSYLIENDLFVTRVSPFSVFENKKICSLSELLSQQCTIWFLRKAEQHDSEKEISTYTPSLGSVEEAFSIESTNKLLWLSDLHFSKDHHAFVKSPGNNNTLFNRLSELADKKISRVIVSGDFTFKASQDEFDLAYDFLHNLKSAYSLSGSGLIICPGNHDIEYSNEPYCDNSPVTEAYDYAKRNFVSFYERIKETKSNNHLSSIHRLITNNGNKVEIISLNTCILQQDSDHFRGMGFAGLDQLRELKSKLKITEKVNAVRILVMHHNLLPVAFSEKPEIDTMYSMLLDSGAISQFCVENKINIVLHGHCHQHFYSKITRKHKDKDGTYTVVGLGSTGAIRDDLSEGSLNEFGIIEFKNNEVIVSIQPFVANGDNETNNPTVYRISLEKEQ